MLREFVARKYKQVAKLIKPGSSVLDIGCNTGELLDVLPKADYVGVDINKEEIKKLRNKGIKASALDLNKDRMHFNKKFDYVVALDICEHILDPAGMIREFKKILKPEGQLVISLPNDYHLFNKIRFLFNKNLTKDPFSAAGHLHIFPINEGERFLEKENLVITNQVKLYPDKPRIIPSSVRKFLSKMFPNNFSRGTIYLARFK